ncbi:MAG TPA: hypothetical protein VGK14_06860 [Novimethylophilus sp.]|uniref:hypothetical protein n=1 Tax=Novimethylophilus sp. TaxID=2137426 RepID=UPI002F427837
MNTLKAYACPIHKCTANAAGGISQRLYPLPAVILSLEKNPDMFSPEYFLLIKDCDRPAAPAMKNMMNSLTKVGR